MLALVAAATLAALADGAGFRAEDVALTCQETVPADSPARAAFDALARAQLAARCDARARFADEGIATLRVSYRAPNDLGRCVHDALAAADVAARQGARRFVTIGHSFGGAVAVQLGMAMGDFTAGVVTLATQSAGCEDAEGLADTPMLLFHGAQDEILPPFASEVVHQLAGGHGELVVLPGEGHLLSGAGDILRERLGTWVPERLRA